VIKSPSNELAELMTLNKTLIVVTRWNSLHDESKVGLKAIGGVEAIARVLQSFPKCHNLQWRGCSALRNTVTCLVGCSIGKANAIELGGMEVLLVAVNNHLVSADVCVDACLALT
jgi:hypothetical protein